MKLTVFCAAMALAVLPAAAFSMPSFSVTFSEKDLSISKFVHDDDTFDVVGLRRASPLLDPAGFPRLPAERLYVLIPQDRRCTGVNVTYLDTTSLTGDYYGEKEGHFPNF